MGKWRNTELPVEGVHELSGTVSLQAPENEGEIKTFQPHPQEEYYVLTLGE